MENIILEVMNLKAEDIQKRRREDKKEWVKSRRDTVLIPKKRVCLNRNVRVKEEHLEENKTLPHCGPVEPEEPDKTSSKTTDQQK